MNVDDHRDEIPSTSSTRNPALVADLRSFLDNEIVEWTRSFRETLDDAIQLLQITIFDEGWEAIWAAAGSDEEAIRESVALYERGLADLFGFVRVSGALVDPVAWSQMKADFRREAFESGTEITLRTALETGMYNAEYLPLGNHRIYRSWIQALMLFLLQRTATAPPYPGSSASLEDKLLWAYQTLADIEEHERFHAALRGYLSDAEVRRVIEALVDDPVETILAHEERVMNLPRFDLILNTGLRWLASAAARRPDSTQS